MTIPSARELAEIGHTYANGYSYEGEWGIRKKSRSDKAAMENFIQESRETRAEFVAAAVRDAVLDAMIAEAETHWRDDPDTGPAVMAWIQAIRDAA